MSKEIAQSIQKTFASELQPDNTREIKPGGKDLFLLYRSENPIVPVSYTHLRSLGDLEPGAFGVLEPPPERCQELKVFESSVCILPGLGFDIQGYRCLLYTSRCV